jgi:hypothetical protein
MDRARQVLAQGVPPGVPKSYRALADHGNVRDILPYGGDFSVQEGT